MQCLWQLCKGKLEGGLLYWELWKLGLKSTQRQAQKLVSGHSPTVKTRLLSFNRTQFRVVISLFIRHNTLTRYFLLNGAERGVEQRKNPPSMFCVAAKLWLHSNISGLLFLDPEDVRSVQVWGPSWTSVEEQGSHDLASDNGAQRAHLKAKVHRDWKGSNPTNLI